MKVWGQLIRAGLETLVNDPTTFLWTGRHYFDSSVGAYKIYYNNQWNIASIVNLVSPGTVKYKQIADGDPLDLTSAAGLEIAFGYVMNPSGNPVTLGSVILPTATSDLINIAIRIKSNYFADVNITTPDAATFDDASSTLVAKGQEFWIVSLTEPTPGVFVWVRQEASVFDEGDKQRAQFLGDVSTDLDDVYMVSAPANSQSRLSIPDALVMDVGAGGRSCAMFDATRDDPYLNGRVIIIKNTGTDNLTITPFTAQTLRNTYTDADVGSLVVTPNRYVALIHNVDVPQYQTLHTDETGINPNAFTAATYQTVALKNAANGYAGLDGSTEILTAQIKSDIARTANVQATSEKDSNNGYAGLTAAGNLALSRRAKGATTFTNNSATATIDPTVANVFYTSYSADSLSAATITLTAGIEGQTFHWVIVNNNGSNSVLHSFTRSGGNVLSTWQASNQIACGSLDVAQIIGYFVNNTWVLTGTSFAFIPT